MILSLGDICLVVAFGVACLYFLSAIRVRELAIQAVHSAASSGDFQLLDQTVHIHRVSLSRDARGRWRVWRQYRFDYSLDGVERRQGYVTMLGKQRVSLVVAEPNVTLH